MRGQKEQRELKRVKIIAHHIGKFPNYARKFTTIIRAEAGGINNKFLPLLERLGEDGNY